MSESRGRSPSGGSGRERAPSATRAPSTSPSRARSGSTSSRPGTTSSYPAPLGFDPAKPTVQEDRGNTRMELPPDAYVPETSKSIFAMRGNKYNSEGKPTKIDVNQYRMTKFNAAMKIYQYDLSLSPNPTKGKKVIMGKIMKHADFTNKMRDFNLKTWIFDGNSLAWSPVLLPNSEIRFMVELDRGRGGQRSSRGDANNFYVTLKKTTEIHMSSLQSYLSNTSSFSSTVREAMNFLDHLIRQRPSENLVAIKRSFYLATEKAKPLGDGAVVEVRKGSYASLRLVNHSSPPGIGLSLNVDIANTAFWVGGQTFDNLAKHFMAMISSQFRGMDGKRLSEQLRPVMRGPGNIDMSEGFKTLRRMKKLKFTIQHKGRRNPGQLYTAVQFPFDKRYGNQGCTAMTYKFMKDDREVSVWEYYASQYDVHLKFPNLPLIDAGKGGMIPMELAVVEKMQKYVMKLTPDQTAAMIKIAVTRPPGRRADIENAYAMLQYPKDPYLDMYGLQFESSFSKTDAKILPTCKVDFARGSADPKFAGRWDLRGKQFYKKNAAPLSSWGIVAMDGCADQPTMTQFATTFRKTFLGHGGVCPQEALVIPNQRGTDAAKMVENAFNFVKEKRGYPQLLFIVVQFKNDEHYERLKRSTDIRFGILSQVVNLAGVRKNDGQYHSNVSMKVNAKLGGATSRTMPPWKSTTYFPPSRPTMIIGLDVSHAAPGSSAPSAAAMTMSVDPDATRYASMVETNGYRVEVLSTSNIRFLFESLLQHWKAGHPGAFPAHIIYLRDGVGEGQFAAVLTHEIAEIKKWFGDKAPQMPLPKFTVIIATKRHHIRFFPQSGDKNGNALPGTLVEREVTHPFMLDFYLCSHVAIQGTSRPVHYTVLVDEMNMDINALQKMIYHQCYSYARSTTPVSLHPAVYYSHLASNRARAHENLASSEGPRTGGKGHEVARDRAAKGIVTNTSIRDGNTESPPFLVLGGELRKGMPEAEERQRKFTKGTMWYI